MNEQLLRILKAMVSKNIIGHKHAPERLIILPKIKLLSKAEQKQFYKEYHGFIQNNYFWRIKKRTGKGSEWHISIDPDLIQQIKKIIGESDEISSSWEIL
jgi:hypothetical protein